MSVQPRCPWCNASGLNHIAIKKLGGVAVVHCGQCGAVYGVTPLPETNPTPPAPASDKTAPAKKQGLLKNTSTSTGKPPHIVPAKPSPAFAEPDEDEFLGTVSAHRQFHPGYGLDKKTGDDKPKPRVRKKRGFGPISRGTPIDKPYRTPGIPDPIPHQSDENLTRDQLGAMLNASAGGMYYQIFNDEEEPDNE